MFLILKSRQSYPPTMLLVLYNEHINASPLCARIDSATEVTRPPCCQTALSWDPLTRSAKINPCSPDGANAMKMTFIY